MRSPTPLLALCACQPEGFDVQGKADGDVADYELRLVPVAPGNQDPFGSLTQLDLVVEFKAGEPDRYTLSTVESGASPEVTDLPALDETTLALEGFTGTELVAFGRSDPITLSTGSEEVRVLVSEVDQFAWMTLAEANFLGAAAPDGKGRYLLFGGNTQGTSGGANKTVGTVWAIDVAPPTDNLSFFEIGDMPPTHAGAAGRMDHTATLLTGETSYKGMILVAGGTTSFMDGDGTTWSAFLWDPATDQVEELGLADALQKPRFGHLAVENKSGDVVILGGFRGADGGGAFTAAETVEIFKAGLGHFTEVSGIPTGPMMKHAAASIGTGGVLACGGLSLEGGYDLAASLACDIITTSGELTAGPSLQEPAIGASMAPLGENAALLTGGLVPTSTVFSYQDEHLDASRKAWYYDGSNWSFAGMMNHPRAFHASATLPDGRVLIAGGVTEVGQYGAYGEGDYGMTCAEIWDPIASSFTEVEPCDESSDSNPLPGRQAMPTIAVDPQYGVLVAGGLNTTRAGDNAALFVPAPDR